MSWKDLEDKAPEMAAFGRRLFDSGVAYLATVRKDGTPRVHPVTPIIGRGHLFLFMEPATPKGHDLRRDGRYALHSDVSDTEGSNGKYAITGRAELIDDLAVRLVALQVSRYTPSDRYVLFELSVQSAISTTYVDGNPVHHRWSQDEVR